MDSKWLSFNSGVPVMYAEDIEVTTDGQTIINLNESYVMGINMIDVYVNGVYQERDVWWEVDENTIEFIPNNPPSSKPYLKEGWVVSIRYRASSINLGNIRVAGTYNALQQVNGVYNEVALVTSTKKFYIYGNNGWEEFIIPFSSSNIGSIMSYEKIVVTDIAERTYDLQEIVYRTGTNDMLVFLDGVKVDPDDYTEVDENTITFHNDLPVGSQELEFIVHNTEIWEETYNHEVDYTYNQFNGYIESKTVIHESNTVSEQMFEYDSSGNLTRELLIKNGKNIETIYTYDLNDNIIKRTVIIT